MNVKSSGFMLIPMVIFFAFAPMCVAQQKEIRSIPEYNSYMAMFHENDPSRKALAAEKFLKDFPDSVMKEDTLEILLGAYSQASETAKLVDTANRLLSVNPKNNKAQLVHDWARANQSSLQPQPLSTISAQPSSSKPMVGANTIRAQNATQAPTGNPSTNAKGHAPAVPQAFQNGVHWSSTPIPESMTVAFSFSERCLRDECGDGAWGAAINRDSNGAIQAAQDGCLSMTTRHGCNTGGRYFIQCKPGDGPKWVALAIYDDQVEELSDGEAMGYDTQATAEQWAVSNCHLAGCHVVWSQAIQCGEEETTGSKGGRCKAVRLASAYSEQFGQYLVYGWARTDSLEQAITIAKEAAKTHGGKLPDVMDPNMDQYYLRTTCDKPHGAIATALKLDNSGQGALGAGIYHGVHVVFDDDMDVAKTKAVSTCNAPYNGQKKPQMDCTIEVSW
jgi:hypothetical protein